MWTSAGRLRSLNMPLVKNCKHLIKKGAGRRCGTCRQMNQLVCKGFFLDRES